MYTCTLYTMAMLRYVVNVKQCWHRGGFSIHTELLHLSRSSKYKFYVCSECISLESSFSLCRDQMSMCVFVKNLCSPPNNNIEYLSSPTSTYFFITTLPSHTSSWSKQSIETFLLQAGQKVLSFQINCLSRLNVQFMFRHVQFAWNCSKLTSLALITCIAMSQSS